MTRLFYGIAANTLVASLLNTWVWFAITLWVYLETSSVIATSVLAGLFTVTAALAGCYLGALVDRYPKKRLMLASSLASGGFYTLAAVLLAATPAAQFQDAASPTLWGFLGLLLCGTLSGNLRGIALFTLVTVLVGEAHRDRANGVLGTANGIACLVASLCGGVAIGFMGLWWTLLTAIGLMLLVVLHLWTLPIPATHRSAAAATPQRQGLDLRGTIQVVQGVPGLFGLLGFQTLNNLLAGVFMALLDPYGLALMSAQMWGILWGCLLLGFIAGGLAVARWGLSRQPLRMLLWANLGMWTACVVFPLQPSIVLLVVGMLTYLPLLPVAEAAEQTMLQKVIPPHRQGRVLDFAQSLELAASPLTALLMGPLAQLLCIPFMTSGAGVVWLGGWFGSGADRGLALLFIVAGLLGMVATLLAMQSHAYKSLSAVASQGVEGLAGAA